MRKLHKRGGGRRFTVCQMKEDRKKRIDEFVVKAEQAVPKQ